MAVRSAKTAGTSGGFGGKNKQPDKSGAGAGEGERDPREIGHEQTDERPFEQGDAADGDDLIHLIGPIDRQGQCSAEDEKPRDPAPEAGALGHARPILIAIEMKQALRGHREHRFGRHRSAQIYHRARPGVGPGRAPDRAFDRPWLGQRVHR